MLTMAPMKSIELATSERTVTGGRHPVTITPAQESHVVTYHPQVYAGTGIPIGHPAINHLPEIVEHSSTMALQVGHGSSEDESQPSNKARNTFSGKRLPAETVADRGILLVFG